MDLDLKSRIGTFRGKIYGCVKFGAAQFNLRGLLGLGGVVEATMCPSDSGYV